LCAPLARLIERTDTRRPLSERILEVGLRIRWRFTILWTVVCLAALAALLSTAGRPSEPGCFEYCSLNADVARGLVPIVFVGWLVVALLANWLWTLATTTRCPGCLRRIDRSVSSCPACSYDLAAGGPSDERREPPTQTG
jgi:hypothetical protein